jgi:hypothetical protein
MRKPSDFDQVQAAGGFPTVELGGHIIIIKDVRVETTTNGLERIVLKYDMHTTDKQAGFFQNSFDNDNRSPKKWRGVHGQIMFNKNGSTNAFFKNLTDSIKSSNPGWVEPFDDNDPQNIKFRNGFKNKLVGAVFGREQYEVQATGELKFATKIFNFESVAKIKEGVEVPKDKLKYPNGNNPNEDIMPVDDGDMPF